MGTTKPLLQPDDLSELAAGTAVKVVALNSDAAGFEEGHVPGSVWADFHRTFALARPGGIVYGIPSAEEFASLMSALGVAPGVPVVFTDDMHGRWATRAYWVCRLHRHATAHVLDGGVAAWVARGLPVETGPSAGTPPSAYPIPGATDESILATAEQTLAAATSGDALICDVRTREENRGIGAPGRTARRLGRIPRSAWLPWEVALDASGAILPEAALRDRLAPVLSDPRPKITYCQGGVRGAHTWFVLSELLGVPARLYAGSWEEWGNRDDLPVEEG